MVRPDQYFVLSDGTQIKNLKELSSALKKMDDSTYSHHVNKDKNDFYNWIKDAVNEPELAESVYILYDKSDMVAEIERKIENKPTKKTPKPKKIQLSKIDEMLLKEKEIAKREEKILEIEERLEKELSNVRKGIKKEDRFFSREFIQGLIIGFLISLIVGLIYIKFFSV